MQKIVVITGGSSGLGLAMAKKFKAENYFVIIISRNSPQDFQADDFFSCDLSHVESRHELITKLKNRYPKIDVLINNAGIGSYATNYELAEKDLKRLFEINYFAVVNLNQKLLENVENANGTIVNISSVAGLMSVACMGAYCSSKAALYMHSESLRMELKNKNVKVLTICPGRINTGFSKRAIRIREVPNTPSNSSDSAATLANVLFKAIKKGKERVIYPCWYRLPIWVSRIFPKLYRYGNQKVWDIK